MRGNEERVFRAADRASDAAMREGAPDRARDVGIRDKLAESQIGDAAPDIAFELGAVECEGKIEARKLVRKVGFDLPAGFQQ